MADPPKWALDEADKIAPSLRVDIALALAATRRKALEEAEQIADQYIENPTSGPNNNTQEAFDQGMDHMAGCVDSASAIKQAIRALAKRSRHDSK